MLIVDTTVLVYAAGREHVFRDPCFRLMSAAAAGALEVRTTVEVIQEFIHVRSRSRGREDALVRGRAYLTLLGPLLPSEETHLRDGLAIFGASYRLGSFDAVLAAVALAHGAVLVSADHAFAGVPSLDHVVPTQESVAALGA